MTKNCQTCGKEIESAALFCTYCGAKLGAVDPVIALPPNKKQRSKKKLLYRLGVIAAVVLLIVVLNANLLLPWQWGARKNKQVILDYAAEHYPDARFVEAHYNTAQFFIWNNFRDGIAFELDGMKFNIIAEGGKILADGYPKARACKQFDKIIQDGFLKPRGIAAQTDYFFSDNYEEIYPYTGGLGVTVRIRDQGATPQEIGWLYDFYKYWKENADSLRSYSVEIDIAAGEDHHEIWFNKSSEFANEREFYAIFK